MFRSIVPLLRTDAARIEDHLLGLCAEDRLLRFAAGLVTDATIRRYVAAIPFEWRQGSAGVRVRSCLLPPPISRDHAQWASHGFKRVDGCR